MLTLSSSLDRTYREKLLPSGLERLLPDNQERGHLRHGRHHWLYRRAPGHHLHRRGQRPRHLCPTALRAHIHGPHTELDAAGLHRALGGLPHRRALHERLRLLGRHRAPGIPTRRHAREDGVAKAALHGSIL